MTIGLYASSPLTERLFREQFEPLYQIFPFKTRDALEKAFSDGMITALLWETEDHFWVQAGTTQISFFKPLRLQSVFQLLSDTLSQQSHKIGTYLFDPQKRLLEKRGGTTPLTIALREKENEILLYLLNAPERRASRQKLLAHIWGVQPGMETRTLETHIYQLRQKIKGSLRDKEPEILINTEEGYQLVMGT